MHAQGNFSYTRHALRRIAQRGIKTEVLRIALDYGATYSTGQGCMYLQMPKDALAELSRDGIGPDMLAAMASMQVVLGEDGRVVTCYHATARCRATSRRRTCKVRRRAMQRG